MVSVGSVFFTTMKAPILLGREIQPHDTTSSHLVAVVNQVFAQKNFGERNPLGQILTAPDGCATCAFEIAGVSSNALVDLPGTPASTTTFPPSCSTNRRSSWLIVSTV